MTKYSKFRHITIADFGFSISDLAPRKAGADLQSVPLVVRPVAIRVIIKAPRHRAPIANRRQHCDMVL